MLFVRGEDRVAPGIHVQHTKDLAPQGIVSAADPVQNLIALRWPALEYGIKGLPHGLAVPIVSHRCRSLRLVRRHPDRF